MFFKMVIAPPTRFQLSIEAYGDLRTPGGRGASTDSATAALQERCGDVRGLKINMDFIWVYDGLYGFIWVYNYRQRAKVHNGMIWDGIGGSHKKHGVFFFFHLHFGWAE